jgi:hypothetical protein
MDFVREGDTVIVHSMDRLARNLDDLRHLVQTLTQRGVQIEFKIDINMVTGDNHSLNRPNSVALDSIDVAYVPSIKNVREAADDLYSVKTPDSYAGPVQPTTVLF